MSEPTEPTSVDRGGVASRRREVMELLNEVLDPCSVAARRPMGLVEMGLVERVDLPPTGRIEVHLRLTSPACYLMTHLQDKVVAGLSALAGGPGVTVHVDEGLDWSPRLMAPHLRPADATARIASGPG